MRILYAFLVITMFAAVLPAVYAADDHKLVQTWVNPAYEGVRLTKVIVVGIAGLTEERKLFEDKFLTHLREGLRRYELYEKGEEWDSRPPRAESICAGATVESFRAPTEEQPGGVTILDGGLWVAQGDKLHLVDLKTGKTQRSHVLPRPVRGLCAGGGLLYAVDFGWTAGKPIYVIDPGTGEVQREIVTAANKVNKFYAASGIAW